MRVLGPRTIWKAKTVSPENYLAPQNLLVGKKLIWSEKSFGPLNFWVEKYIWVPRYFETKIFGVQNSLDLCPTI